MRGGICSFCEHLQGWPGAERYALADEATRCAMLDDLWCTLHNAPPGPGSEDGCGWYEPAVNIAGSMEVEP